MTSSQTASLRVELTPIDLERSFGLQKLGAFDPTVSASARQFEKSFVAKHGPVRCTLTREESSVHLAVRGPKADDVLADWASTLPPKDGYDSFATEHPLVARLHRGAPGMRLLRAPWLFDVACAVVLQQRVTVADAMRAWRRIVTALGEPHDGHIAFPGAARVAKLATWQLEELGVDPKRARAMIAIAREQMFHPFLHTSTPHTALRARLLSIRGIGPWTTEMILGHGAGDPDAVVTGDLHLPRVIVWTLAREPRGDDARMVELLEPFRPHRFRVSRLLLTAGMDAPRTRDPRPSVRRPF